MNGSQLSDTAPGARADGLPAAVPGGDLMSAQAASQLARDGPNVLLAPRPVRLWWRVAGQVRDPLVLLAAVLTVATGDWIDASVIVLVIVVSTAVGVTQKVKAGQAITTLSRLAAPEARVLRDGQQRLIPAAEVVAGDVLVLPEGDIAAADAQVAEAAALLADEAARTPSVTVGPSDDHWGLPSLAAPRCRVRA